MDKFVHIFTALPEIMVDVLIPSSNPISKTFFWALEKLETTKEAYATPANAIIPCEKQKFYLSFPFYCAHIPAIFL